MWEPTALSGSTVGYGRDSAINEAPPTEGGKGKGEGAEGQPPERARVPYNTGPRSIHNCSRAQAAQRGRSTTANEQTGPNGCGEETRCKQTVACLVERGEQAKCNKLTLNGRRLLPVNATTCNPRREATDRTQAKHARKQNLKRIQDALQCKPQDGAGATMEGSPP